MPDDKKINSAVGGSERKLEKEFQSLEDIIL